MGPPWAAVLQVYLVQHGFSTGFNSFRKYPPALVWGPPWAIVSIAALVWSSQKAAGELLLWCLRHLLPLLILWPWSSQDHFSCSPPPPPPLLLSALWHFTLFKICYHRGITSLVDGLSCVCHGPTVEWAGTSCIQLRAALALPSQRYTAPNHLLVKFKITLLFFHTHCVYPSCLIPNLKQFMKELGW